MAKSIPQTHLVPPRAFKTDFLPSSKRERNTSSTERSAGARLCVCVCVCVCVFILQSKWSFVWFNPKLPCEFRQKQTFPRQNYLARKRLTIGALPATIWSVINESPKTIPGTFLFYSNDTMFFFIPYTPEQGNEAWKKCRTFILLFYFDWWL